MKTLKLARLLLPTLFASLLLSIAINAQTTAFTYQGRLTDASMAANGTYDFQFVLYDANSGGAQQGAMQTITGVNVSAGSFTVQLDFTAAPFAAGANRYLEIRVKKPADLTFTTLLPRQPLTSAPYAIQSLNATNAAQLGGAAAANYLQFNGNGSQLTNVSVDAANLTGVLPIIKGGTGAATQNFVDLTTTQTVAGGKTFSSAVNTTTQYNIGNTRVLSIAGSGNLFAGSGAGPVNTGSYNSFVGAGAGRSNTTGSNNLFVGLNAGNNNSTGTNNSFFGNYAGFNNSTGTRNTAIGDSADVGNPNFTYATAIGADSTVRASNTIALGRDNGLDKVVVYGLGAAGSTQLCRNASNQISTCSSSLRYKTNIAPFSFGLSLVNRLRPISFDWKEGGMKDVGFGAEDVAKINPLFVSFNDKGEVEGVKYDRLSVAFVNAFKEQQVQITEQQTQIRQQKTINQNLQTQVERQQREIDALKKIVCAGNPTADICTETQNEK